MFDSSTISDSDTTPTLSAKQTLKRVLKSKRRVFPGPYAATEIEQANGSAGRRSDPRLGLPWMPERVICAVQNILHALLITVRLVSL
jgi:hypothetical protein